MKAQKTLTAVTLACTLLAGAAPNAGAQERRNERREQTEQQQRQEVIVRQEAEGIVRLPLEPGAIQTMPVTPLRGDTFTFVSTEMSFDHKVVKGAPYSAEAVTESVQVLADGNRITRKNSSQIYRDGEGRTRREFTLKVIGPWASQEEPPRTISINDPVAKVSYTLDPRSRTARKISTVPLQASRAGTTPFTIRQGDVKASELRQAELRELEVKTLNAVKSTLPERVRKRANAVNPKVTAARGDVVVKIKVNESGAVESYEAVLNDNQALRNAALEAARQWQFKPGAAESGGIFFNFDSRESVPGELVQVFDLQKDGEKKSTAITFFKGEHQTPPNVQTEQLGKQLIEGVEAEGTRTTRTIPAGAIGNEQPIKIVSERWYSPELQVVVMTRQSDPRMGEMTYRLTNIVRAEPASSLFQVPSDYTIKDSTEFLRTIPTRRLLPAPQEN